MEREEDRIAMSQRERDVLKIVSGVSVVHGNLHLATLSGRAVKNTGGVTMAVSSGVLTSDSEPRT